MRSNNVLAAILGLVLFAVLILGAYYLIRFGLGLFDGVSPEVTTVTAVIAVTLLLSASIIAGGLHGIGRREEARQQRAARAAVYERFLRHRAGTQRRETLPNGDPNFPPENAHTLEQQMLLHASPEVLKAYLRLRRAESTGGTGTGAPQEMAPLVRAMRKDLGQRSPDVGMSDLTELMRIPSREHA